MTATIVNRTLESGLYVRIEHPDRHLLMRGCSSVSPYRAGFEDCLYARIYANPFERNTVEWSKYDHGNEDARLSMREAKPVEVCNGRHES